MQHFSKQLRTRLLTLYLSAGLVMGGLPGCGSQDLEIADTVAESAVTATADATDVTTFSQPEGPEESTIYVEPVDGISRPRERMAIPGMRYMWMRIRWDIFVPIW